LLRLQPGSPAVAVRVTEKGVVGQPVEGLVQVTATLVPDATAGQDSSVLQAEGISSCRRRRNFQICFAYADTLMLCVAGTKVRQHPAWHAEQVAAQCMHWGASPLVLATLHVPVGLDACRSSLAPVLLLTVKVRVKLSAESHKVVLCVAGDSCTLTVGWDAGVTVVDREAEPPQLPDPADAARETENAGQVPTPCARLHVTVTVVSEGTAGRRGQAHQDRQYILRVAAMFQLIAGSCCSR
jgi:hypothetical protein